MLTSQVLAAPAGRNCGASKSSTAVVVRFPCKEEARLKQDATGPALNVWGSFEGAPQPSKAGMIVNEAAPAQRQAMQASKTANGISTARNNGCSFLTVNPGLYFHKSPPMFTYGYVVSGVPCEAAASALAVTSALQRSGGRTFPTTYSLWLKPTLPSVSVQPRCACAECLGCVENKLAAGCVPTNKQQQLLLACSHAAKPASVPHACPLNQAQLHQVFAPRITRPHCCFSSPHTLGADACTPPVNINIMPTGPALPNQQADDVECKSDRPDLLLLLLLLDLQPPEGMSTEPQSCNLVVSVLNRSYVSNDKFPCNMKALVAEELQEGCCYNAGTSGRHLLSRWELAMSYRRAFLH